MQTSFRATRDLVFETIADTIGTHIPPAAVFLAAPFRSDRTALSAPDPLTVEQKLCLDALRERFPEDGPMRGRILRFRALRNTA